MKPTSLKNCKSQLSYYQLNDGKQKDFKIY